MSAKSPKHNKKTKKNVIKNENLWQLEALEPKLLMSADLMPGVQDIQGSIEQPGEEDVYELVITETSKLFFDGVQGNNINWQLDSIVNNEPVNQFSSQALTGSSDKFKVLTPGTYRLTVDGNNQTVDNYKFRILGEQAAETLTTNQAVTGELTGSNQAKLFRISVSKGDSLFFKGDATNQGQWSLFDNRGNQVINNGYLTNDHGVLTVNEDGDYWLSIEGAPNTEKSNYNFTLYQQAKQAPITTTLTTLNSIQFQPGGQYVYDITLENTGLLALDFLIQPDSGISWSVVNKITNQNVLLNSREAILSLNQGEYRITLSNNGRFTGENQLRLLAASQNDNFVALPLSFDYTPETSYQAQLKAIHVTEPGNYTVDTQDKTYNYSLYDKYYHLITKTTLSDSNSIINLPKGDFYLWLDPQLATTVSYTLNISRQSEQPVVAETNPVVNSPLVLNTTTTINGINGYKTTSYALNVTDTSYLSLNLYYYISAEIYDSNNQLVQSLAGATNHKILLEKGSYTVKFNTYYYNTNYTAYLSPIQTLTPNQAVSIAPESVTQPHFLAVNLVAGQRYAISATPSNNISNSINVNLYDNNKLLQSGNAYQSRNGHWYDQNMVFIVPHDGVYYLEVPAHSTETHTYSLQTGTITNVAYEIGNAYQGGDFNYQDQINHPFEITQADKYLLSNYVDANSYMVMKLIDSDGKVTDISNQTQLIDLAVGHYTLQVNKTANRSGSLGYGFNILNVTTLAQLPLDEQVTGSANDSRLPIAWKLQASQGQTILIDARSPNTSGQNWLLLDKDGKQITRYETWGNNDYSKKVTIPTTGEYYLVSFNDYNSNNNRADYPSLRNVLISDYQVHHQTIELGQQVTGQLIAGDAQQFDFSLDSAKNIALSIRNGNYNIRLLGADLKQNVRSLSASETSLQNFYLPAGNYRIEIDAAGATTPSYDFKLVDIVSEAKTLTNNNGVLSGQVAADSSLASYTLDVQAGQQYGFKFENVDNYKFMYRLVDEEGRVLADNRYAYQIANFVPSITGKVYLIINKLNAAFGSATDFNIRLTQTVKQTKPLMVDQEISGQFNTASDQDNYQFQVSQAGYYQLTQVTASNSNIRFELLNPDGTLLFSHTNLATLRIVKFI